MNVAPQLPSMKSIPLLSLCLWLTVLVAGFGYVAVVLCGRRQPLESGNNSFADCAVLTLLCLGLFFTGPHQSAKIEPPLKWRSFLSWAVFFLVPFFTALHWAFVGSAIGARFSLIPGSFSDLDLRSAIALGFAALLISLVAAYHLWLAQRALILVPYLTVFSSVVVTIVAVTIASADTHYLHFHHYCVGLLFFPFCRFPTRISLACQAFFLGLAVEGVSRWGMDAIWCAR